MKKIIITIIVICLLQSNDLKADYTQDISGGGSNCTTIIQDRDKNSFLTFFGDSLGDFVDLINITLGLVIVRMQKDYNPPDGIPNEVLDMAKSKAVEFRQDINTELVKRGVTSL